jgi:hypothetical protein
MMVSLVLEQVLRQAGLLPAGYTYDPAFLSLVMSYASVLSIAGVALNVSVLGLQPVTSSDMNTGTLLTEEALKVTPLLSRPTLYYDVSDVFKLPSNSMPEPLFMPLRSGQVCKYVKYLCYRCYICFHSYSVYYYVRKTLLISHTILRESL